MSKLEIEVGMVFGKLTVVKQYKHLAKWDCSCSCGGSVDALDASKLRANHTSSCGCMRDMHGMRYHPAYKSWLHMKQRCTNPDNQDYHKYGGRGIKVHPDLFASFPTWLSEIGERPEGPRWSIGRIDNNGDYTYGNMRWENDAQQARNHGMLVNNKSGFVGVLRRTKIIAGKEYHTWVAQWAEELNKKKSKDFSCNKYGEEAAKQMAIDYRARMIEQLNAEGFEYADSHGTERAVKE